MTICFKHDNFKIIIINKQNKITQGKIKQVNLRKSGNNKTNNKLTNI